MYDLTIIGGGPAGITAGVYAARKKLKTLFITEEWGGQSNVSADIQNWIGTPHISGTDLAKNLETHIRAYANDVVTIMTPAKVTTITKTEKDYTIVTDKGESYTTRAVFIASGSHRRRIQVPGADEFEHKGLTYCATCDGPLFSDKDVVVVGGGNAGFETANQLLEYTKSVTLLDRGPAFRADEITVAKITKNPSFKSFHNIAVTEVHGDTFVNGISYKDTETEEEKKLDIDGIFVEIGLIPNTDIVAELVERDDHKHIKVDPYTQRTSQTGIWAAGDCTDGLYHQNNIASGDAVKAIEDMYHYLR